MLKLNYRLRYLGGDADENLLPAHEGAQSIEAMAWSFSLIGNYAATGQIRKRGNLDPRIKFFIHPPSRGSFVTDIVAYVSDPNNIFLTSVVGTYTVATAGNVINGLIKYSFNAVFGLVVPGDDKNIGKLSGLPSGDLEALVDGIEPSVSRAHGVIGEGAERLSIQKGRTPLLEFNRATRSYVKTSILETDIIEREVSVGALNVNTGNGRAYLPDIGKTFAFSVIKEPLAGTYQALSRSFDRAARGLTNDVNIYCQEIISVNGVIKKLIIHSATQGS